MRRIVDFYVQRCSNVNICALDLSKAFDKMNFHGLFLKLMQRNFPAPLLSVFEYWFNNSATCIKCDNFLSTFYRIECGVRQGGVLSPYFFAMYIDKIIQKIKSLKIGCEICCFNLSILMYADDIILCSPSVSSLQRMLWECDRELAELDMVINATKTKCLRFGPDFKHNIRNLTTIDKNEIFWEVTVRYLGCFLVSKSNFSVSLDHCKRQFYIAFNSVYSKVGGIGKEDVIIHLLKTKCLPRLLYGLEAVPLLKSQINSLEYVISCALIKIFKTKSKEILFDCMTYFNVEKIESVLDRRRNSFLSKIKAKCLHNNILYYVIENMTGL